MSKTKRLLSPLECLQLAWAMKLRDFRQWCMPTTQGVYDWKRRRLEAAIVVAKTSMVDDVESMLKAIQENDNAKNAGYKNKSGSSVYLPVLMTAISPIETPPEYDQVGGLPYWVNVVLPQDPLKRVVQMRSVPVAYRCQIAFFSPDPHSASDIARQFANFWKHEEKRTFPVSYDVGVLEGKAIKDDWNFRVLENSLYPDNASIDLKNLFIVTVDCTIVGAIPEIVGLGGDWDEVTDTGEPQESLPTRPNPEYDPEKPTIPLDPENPEGPAINPPRVPIPGDKPVEGNRDSYEELNSLVIEANVDDEDSDHEVRVAIDPDTGVITETNVAKKGATGDE